MNQRTLLFILLTALLISMPARADLIQVQLQMRSLPGALLYSSTAYVSDPAVEFKPFNQISFDFTGGGDVTFLALVSGNLIGYDAIFTVLTPHYRFRGISPLAPATANYVLSYDAAQQRIVFHHNPGYVTKGETVSFHADVTHAPEPSSLVLLGTGLMFVAGVLRRRRR